jgi:small subunit ribosomal protein S3
MRRKDNLGQKAHPCGFRLGISQNWQAKWYAEGNNYARFLQQDLLLRKTIKERCPEGGIAQIEIERPGDEISLTIYTARPGILIGRGGQNVEALRAELERISKEKIRLTIKEIETPQLQACLVAQNVAEQIENRIPFRRAMKQASFRTLQAGAKGVKIRCSGRLGGREIARSETLHQGQMPLHTLRANIDYGFAEAHTIMGRIGVKVWIYKGEILSEVRREGVTAEASKV